MSPSEFGQAVASLAGVSLRPEVVTTAIKAPQRLAPDSYALAIDVVRQGDCLATGRLVVLHDPQSRGLWGGPLRLVGFASAEIDPGMGRDPLLAEVGWSWLTDSLRQHQAPYIAAGGTVTETASTRFGDLAGQQTTLELELRASWTPLELDLAPHLRAWADLLASAAGLPPEGVSLLPGVAERRMP
ncbi:MAG: DUF3000 domain-containing protein [Actinobacteria bacterium]|nr:DUF3000 domain-containing protein [Actinomycetota bacterium]